MCHSVNMAIKRIIETGVPISVSVMFACPWYQEAVDILKAHPEVGVGVHLTLNSEWKNYRWGPVLGREAVPSLVDSNGYFYPSRTLLYANNPPHSEIERELRAQLERALNSGIRIDYLDYHMGAAVHTPELRAMVENLAREYGLGMSGYFGEKYSNVTYLPAFEDKADSLLAHLKRMGPGFNLQVIHVGLDEPEMQAMIDLNEFGLEQVSRHRQAELHALLTPDIVKIWLQRGIRPLTYRQLMEKLGREAMHREPDAQY
jgi:hypothetical protein